MGNILAPGANGQVVEVPAGTTTGTIALNFHDVTFAGPRLDSRDTHVIKSDAYNGANALFVCAFPPQTPTVAITVVDASGNWITAPGHGLAAGDGPVYFQVSGGSLPTGLVSSLTPWYVFAVSNDKFQVSSALGAVAPLDITGTGSGTLTFNQAIRSLTVENCTIDIRPVALSFADVTFTVDASTDLVTATAHGFLTGDGPVRLTNTGGALPAGLATGTDYWITKWTADTFKFAKGFREAWAGVPVDITGAGTGTQKVTAASTERSSVYTGLPTSQYAGPVKLYARNVRIMRYHASATAVLLQYVADVQLVDVLCEGDGQAVAISAGTRPGARIDLDLDVRGGYGGVIVSADGFTTRNLTTRGSIRLGYHQGHAGEACTATAFGVDHVDVSAFVLADRTLYDVVRPMMTAGAGALDADSNLTVLVTGAQAWDRLEDSIGTWAECIGVDANGHALADSWHEPKSFFPSAAGPSGTITALRPVYGRLYDWYGRQSSIIATPGRLALQVAGGATDPPTPHWRVMAGGLITCVTKANLTDGDYLDVVTGNIDDIAAGEAFVRYEFDKTGDGVTAGSVAVTVTSDTTAAQVAARLKTAIAANQPLLHVVDNADGTLSIGVYSRSTVVRMHEYVANAGFLAQELWAATPTVGACARVDLLRASTTSTRDVDVGAIHYTAHVEDSEVIDLDARDLFSDIITLRGKRNKATRVKADNGQDMLCTLDCETVTLSDCEFTRPGFDGIVPVEGAHDVLVADTFIGYCGQQRLGGATDNFAFYPFTNSDWRVDNLTFRGNVAGEIGGIASDGTVTRQGTAKPTLSTAPTHVAVTHVGSGTTSGGVLSFAGCAVGDRVQDANGIWGLVEYLDAAGHGVVPHWHAAASFASASEPGGAVNAYHVEAT